MATVSRDGNIFRLLRICVLIHCLVLLQVSTVHCQTYNSDWTLKSMLPFCIDLPNTLRSGEVIKIMGSVDGGIRLGQPLPWLDVVFRSRCLDADSPFYLKMRFDNRTVVRNSFQNGNWENQETDGQFPFSLGAPFVLLIEIQPHGYKVTGNGIELWTFPYRQTSVTMSVLQAIGVAANIRRVELIHKADMNQPSTSQIIYPVPLESQPVRHPSFPFWGYFPRGLQAGNAILIKGLFPTTQERTSINLRADDFKGPIMMHLDLRFRLGIDNFVVVRNSYIDGKWGNNEERGGSSSFPFQLREPFAMLIEVQPDCYNISVNGIPYCTYGHRLPFTQVTSMTIEIGPMKIWEVQYIDKHENPAKALMTTEEASPPTCFTSSTAAGTYNNFCYSILFICLTCSLKLV